MYYTIRTCADVVKVCYFVYRFCTECKNKVLHAHGLLKGDDGKSKDKSYCPAMYDGIKFSKKTMHLHIRNNVEFIASLIARAEPDLMGR